MTYDRVAKIYARNQKTKDNTYLVPGVSFDDFIRDELMFVRKADGTGCTVFRAMDGKLYNLTEEQLKKFKCVGNC